MTDVHNQAIRSKNMRAIRSKDTGPEVIIRKALHASGFRYRLHTTNLPGSPDLVLPKYKAVIFVHGCFWHGHRCHLSKTPKTRTEFWLTKISANMSRDNTKHQQLMESNWRVAVIWECAIKGKMKLDSDYLLSELINWLRDSKSKSIELSGK
ncbi:very short patch repair endonuclease [Undibacterium sp. Ji50W]|uniref:very short patch repair endonuclease n=1 Tax=Undibacterium sp. Ji50W TaxID=3413041 RepID=UPI003BF3BD86